MCGAAFCSDHRFTDASRDAVYSCRPSSLSCNAFTPAQCCARSRRRPAPFSLPPLPPHAALLAGQGGRHHAVLLGTQHTGICIPNTPSCRWPSCQQPSLTASLPHRRVHVSRVREVAHTARTAGCPQLDTTMKHAPTKSMTHPDPVIVTRGSPLPLVPAGTGALTTAESLAAYHRR